MRQQRYLCESTVRCSIDRSDRRSQESAGDSATMDEFSRQVPNHSGDSSARNNTAHKQTPKQQRRQPRQCKGMRDAVGGHPTPAGLSEPQPVADRPIRCTAWNLRGWMLIGAGSVHRTAFGCDATDGRSSERCFRCFREGAAPDRLARPVDDVPVRMSGAARLHGVVTAAAQEMGREKRAGARLATVSAVRTRNGTLSVSCQRIAAL